jgi:hypothetical protein
MGFSNDQQLRWSMSTTRPAPEPTAFLDRRSLMTGAASALAATALTPGQALATAPDVPWYFVPEMLLFSGLCHGEF